MLELLVEQMAQAAELVGIAQLVGLDDLVSRHAEGAVDRVLVRPAARLVGRAAWSAGIVVAGARHHLAIGLGGAVFLRVGFGAVGRVAVHRRLRAGGGAFAAVGLVLAVLFLALALVVIG